jgi:F0F1-type ATP synthase assembly protein I
MSASILAAVRRQALQVLLWQALLMLVLAGICLAAWGAKAALSVSVGGGIGVIATAFMAFALLRQSTDATANRIAISFFVGWVVKVFLTVALLSIAMRSKSMSPPLLLAGFALTFVAYWLVYARRRN